jgi:hypothetical protein
MRATALWGGSGDEGGNCAYREGVNSDMTIEYSTCQIPTHAADCCCSVLPAIVPGPFGSLSSRLGHEVWFIAWLS